MNGQVWGRAKAIAGPSNPRYELITNSQVSRLKTLSERAQSPESFDMSLSKHEAADRIERLTAILALTNELPIAEW